MSRNIKLFDIILDKSTIIIGDNINVQGLNLVNRQTQYKSILSYVTNDSYLEHINKNDSIKALVLPKKLYEFYQQKVDRKITFILSNEPEKLFYEIHNYLTYKTSFYEVYDFETTIGKNTEIADSAIIQNGVLIGENVKIGSNSVIKSGSIIEDNVTIGCNTTIGSEGFQVVGVLGNRVKIPHMGRTKIKKGSFVSDNCAIANSLFEGFVEIGENVYIDNLCHIAHNCIVESNAVITAGVILCGSVTICENAWIGTNTTLLNNVNIGKNSKIGIGSVVTRSIPENSIAYGSPAKVSKSF